MAMSLFPDDDYEEVAARVTGSLSDWGCWNAAWSVPTASGITQARKRLGRNVMPEVFEGVAEAVATSDTRGAWLREWRLLAIDGFEVDLPDTPANAGEFGYAGSGASRSAFPKARVVALAECGTHAFLAAEAGAWTAGEKTVASRLYPRLRPGELLTADRNFYSWDAWQLAAGTGAALLWRAPTQLDLPVVAVLPDGSYLSVLVNPGIPPRPPGSHHQGRPRRAGHRPRSRAPGPGRRVRRARPGRQRLRRADRAADHDHRPGRCTRRRARVGLPPAVGGRNRE
jgi:hypothetical protein